MTFFYMFLISLLNSLLSIIADITTPMPSASGNDIQDNVTPPILIRTKASGNIPKNCLVSDTIKL